jgi:flagellar biosynthesis chaperone FliJ
MARIPFFLISLFFLNTSSLWAAPEKPQVLIEAKIVEVTPLDINDIGVDWAGPAQNGISSHSLIPDESNEYGVKVSSNPDHNRYYSISTKELVIATRWRLYITQCKPCETLVRKYNGAMQDLFNARAMATFIRYIQKTTKPSGAPSPNNKATEAEMAKALAEHMDRRGLYEETLPNLDEAIQNLETTTNHLRQQIAECEKQCNPKGEENSIPNLMAPAEVKAVTLPFNWKGPYPEVCEKCRKLAARLNQLPAVARENENQINIYNAKKSYIESLIKFREFGSSKTTRKEREKLKELRKELKAIKKNLKRLLKNREKIIENFNQTLKLYKKCIRTCPIQKTAIAFPNDTYESIIIGPNNQFGSSAQTKKEIRNKLTGAATGAATKALGGLLGGSGVSLGGGKSSGPDIYKDPTKGKFTRISSGNTDLDIRAGWNGDQLVVSTNIDDTPGKGTFHAQWIEDAEGNTYLPVRYLIIEMYRDWKLTVSWTEDHYVNGQHVYHNEGQAITTGRDHLGTWNLFKGQEGAANSIWGMLGFETAVKGVKHIAAIYNIPPSIFPDQFQMQLVTHISQPKKDPVSTIPLVGDLFKHKDESKRRPELIVLIQPHMIKPEEVE